MARLARVCPMGAPQHVIQRGNNRQVCFGCEEDFAAYAGWLKEYASKFGVEVHAWVLMTNHVHLLCTPRREKAVSLLMQALGRRYVQYFNYTYKRSGTLWEGRFRSSLIQAEEYLLLVYRYIELNPVRANMVEQPSDYAWSSYQINALGKPDTLCTPHELYLALGDDPAQRQERYRALFAAEVDGELLSDIRKTLNSGMALGNERFAAGIEKLTGRRMVAGKRGRPVGWRKQEAEGDCRCD
jgi:putative transposase